MSLPIRLAGPSSASSSHPLLLTLASRVARQSCTTCTSPLRFRPRLLFSSTRTQPSSKRKLATSAAAVASHPPTLDPSPPPPRSAGASSVPRVNDVRPPVVDEESMLGNGNATAAFSTTLPRSPTPQPPSEQRQGALSQASPSASQDPSPAKKARPKLRPRKAAISLTPTAVARLRSLLAQPSPKLIRVGVRNKGCSGLAYHLEYVEKPGMMDEVVAQDGVSVVIESRALLSVIGSEMDWVSEKLGEKFVFRNPNIKEQCGCGESFMV